MELFFDTETSGMVDRKAPVGAAHQPDIIQLAMILTDGTEECYEEDCIVVDPSHINPSWSMHPEAEKAHGMSYEFVIENGIHPKIAVDKFLWMCHRADGLVCHNEDFDRRLMATLFHRLNDLDNVVRVLNCPGYCTMKKSTNFCKLPGLYGKYKWPTLMELHVRLFGEEFEGAHDALADCRATARCYYALRGMGL